VLSAEGVINNMAKKNKENKNFRKESKKQEKLLYSVIGVLAIILAFVIVLTKKIDFAACSNTGEGVVQEDAQYEPSPAPLPELFEDEAGGDSTADDTDK